MTYCYLIQVPTIFHELSISFSITSEDFRLSILELLINILSVSRPKATSGVGGKATSRSTDHSSYLLGRLQGSIYLLLLTETLGILLAEGNGSLRGSCVLRRSHQAQHYSSSNHFKSCIWEFTCLPQSHHSSSVFSIGELSSNVRINAVSSQVTVAMHGVSKVYQQALF